MSSTPRPDQSSEGAFQGTAEAPDLTFSLDPETLRRNPTPIALVNVPYGRRGGQSMRPLGLSYLGAYIESHGIQARGFDFSDSTLSPEELVTKHNLAGFPSVGLSFYNINARLAYRMARAIKSQNPRSIVLGGGPHASATHSRAFQHHPEIDFLVRNEGEETLLEVLHALREGRPMSQVAGVSFARDGHVVINPDRERIACLDDLPPPVFRFERDEAERPHYFYDRETGQLKPATALVTSRSCPYDCSFCAIILIGRAWRKASPQKVVEDLQALEKFHGQRYTHLYFLDANFFVDARRALEVAAALHRFRPELTFSFSTRVNQLIRGKALLPQLRSHGLRAVELGIESGSDKALTRFTKRTTTEMNEEAFSLLKENNLQLFMDFIMFDAEADLEDLGANIAFLERNGLDSYVSWDHIFSHMTPYLGTAIRSHYEDLLGRQFDDDLLPEPESLFLNHDVRAVFLEIKKLLPHLPKMTSILAALEEEVDTAEWGPETARRKLNAATFRRLPFVTLRSLVRQARAGEDITFEQALPRFFDDRGASFNFEEFLHHALH